METCEGNSYEGGDDAGGKFRKRQFRKAQTTPYDRPLTAVRNPGRNSSWVSKLVAPASRLVSSSTHSFFSSLLRKRLPPPPPPPPPHEPPPETSCESRDRLQEATPINPPAVQESVYHDGNGLSEGFVGSGISELEQILKQRTFTRSEIDRLMDLLHSRTVDLPGQDEDKKMEMGLQQPLSSFNRLDEYASSPRKGNSMGRNMESPRFGFNISTPVVSSLGIEEDISSPAQLAKAYMGSKTLKVSPSTLGLRSQALREDANLLNNVSFPSKSPVMSLVKPAGLVGVRENGFFTPRSRGRSALYSMARTPYSKVHPTPTLQGTTPIFDSSGRISASSQYGLDGDKQLGSKHAQKRRSSVIDDDIGSVGPIRRIRQKTYLSTPMLSLPADRSHLTRRGSGIDYVAVQEPSSSTQRLYSLDEPKHRTSKIVGENEDINILPTSYTPVPPKSTEVATRILEHLEKLVPKEKSAESKVVVKGTLLSKSSPDMHRGQAHRNLEDVDSSKILVNVQDSQKLNEFQKTCMPDACDATAGRLDKFEENCQRKLKVSSDRSVLAVNNGTAVSTKDNLPCVKIGASVTSESIPQPFKKKQSFQMRADEDFREQDHNVHSNVASSTSLAKGKEKLETSLVESKPVSYEVVSLLKTSALSQSKIRSHPAVEKPNDNGTSYGSVVGEKASGFAIAAASASTTTSLRAPVSPQSTTAVDEIVSSEELNVPHPSFSFSFKNVDKVPLFAFSASSPVTETSGSTSQAPSEIKPGSLNSFVGVASSAADNAPSIPESDNAANKHGSEIGEGLEKSGTPVSSAVATPKSIGSIFTFGDNTNKLSLSNGSLASNSVSSSPFPSLISDSFTTQTSTNIFAQTASSTVASVITTNGTLTATTLSSSSSSFSAAPSFTPPIFSKFGFNSVASSNSISSVPTATNTGSIDLKSKNEKEPAFSYLTNSHIGGTSFGLAASAGSSIFGLSTSIPSSANNLSEGGSGGSSVTLASSSGTRFATVTQSMPFQSGSSSSVFGSSGTNSRISTFGSTAAKLFSSSGVFGASSSASASETNSISSSGPTSSMFGFNWQPSKSSTVGSTSTSASPSTGFSFGQSSASAVASTIAPMVFGSSTASSSGSILSFTSAAAASSSQGQTVFGGSFPAFNATSNASDQMTMEDSMAEDPVQASTPAVPAISQPTISPPLSGIVFGSTPPAHSPFQFSGQLNQGGQSNQSPFQASGSLEFGAGGSFSLGSGGDDKSNRKFIRVKHKGRRK